jgi:hypothetical protein
LGFSHQPHGYPDAGKTKFWFSPPRNSPDSWISSHSGSSPIVRFCHFGKSFHHTCWGLSCTHRHAQHSCAQLVNTPHNTDLANFVRCYTRTDTIRLRDTLVRALCCAYVASHIRVQAPVFDYRSLLLHQPLPPPFYRYCQVWTC